MSETQNKAHHRLTPQRLAWGVWDFPDYRMTKLRGREFFLYAIADYHYEVLQHLAEAPLRALQELPEDYRLARTAEIRRTLLGMPDEFYLPGQADKLLIAQLHAWGEHWHLDVGWALAHALQTLMRWDELAPESGPVIHEKTGAIANWAVNQWHAISESVPFARVDPLLEIPLAGMFWHPGLEEWDDYERRWIGQLQVRLDEHRAEMEQAATTAGMTPITERRAFEHLVWLAHFQVMVPRMDDMLVRARSDQPAITKSGLTQALRSAAKLIDIPLVKSPHKGRRPGSLDKQLRRPSR